MKKLQKFLISPVIASLIFFYFFNPIIASMLQKADALLDDGAAMFAYANIAIAVVILAGFALAGAAALVPLVEIIVETFRRLIQRMQKRGRAGVHVARRALSRQFVPRHTSL